MEYLFSHPTLHPLKDQIPTLSESQVQHLRLAKLAVDLALHVGKQARGEDFHGHWGLLGSSWTGQERRGEREEMQEDFCSPTPPTHSQERAAKSTYQSSSGTFNRESRTRCDGNWIYILKSGAWRWVSNSTRDRS